MSSALLLPFASLKEYYRVPENKIKIVSIGVFGIIIPPVLFCVIYVINKFLIGKGWVIPFISGNEYFGFPRLWEFWAVYLGIAALLIGIIVILNLVGNVANNTEQFLRIFFKILDESHAGDELIVIAPTIMIEKLRFPERYQEYRDLLISKLRENVKINFCFFSTKIFDEFNKISNRAEKDMYLNKNKEIDPLIKFHLNFTTSDFAHDTDKRVGYFEELIEFYSKLEDSSNFKYTKLKMAYETNRFISVANKKKGIYFFGAYELNRNGAPLDYSAAKFETGHENTSVMLTFNSFLEQTLQLLKE